MRQVFFIKVVADSNVMPCLYVTLSSFYFSCLDSTVFLVSSGGFLFFFSFFFNGSPLPPPVRHHFRTTRSCPTNNFSLSSLFSRLSIISFLLLLRYSFCNIFLPSNTNINFSKLTAFPSTGLERLFHVPLTALNCLIFPSPAMLPTCTVVHNAHSRARHAKLPRGKDPDVGSARYHRRGQGRKGSGTTGQHPL